MRPTRSGTIINYVVHIILVCHRNLEYLRKKYSQILLDAISVL